MTPASRAECAALDAADPLAGLREQFDLPDGVIYLDGNSLGPLPRTTAGRVAAAVTAEWGNGLVRSWNGHDGGQAWIELPRRVGDKIARLIGAGPGEVVVTDSTSVNLFKALSAATARQRGDGREVLLAETGAFPTDLYLADSVARSVGAQLVTVEPDRVVAELTGPLGGQVAVLLVNHVDYRTGRMHDLAAVVAAAHAAGALTVVDLAHSAGAVPVDLLGADADLAVGCGYKYLNGGPGAPAFLWCHPRWHDELTQPLTGWFGHAEPFAFSPDFRPAQGIGRFLTGTPAVLSMTALECGVDTLLAAEPMGGMAALRAASLRLTSLFAERVAARCPDLRRVGPSADAERGSQVSFAHDGAFAVVQALIARGVIGDFRAPDVMRFGFAPAFLRRVDAWDAAETLADVLATQEWREERFRRRGPVT